VESSILSSVSLEAGLAAIQQERHQDAISILEAFCHDCAANAQWTNRSYLQAQMHLVKTYSCNAQIERAIVLCQRLTACDNAQVQIWAQQTLKTLGIGEIQPEAEAQSGRLSLSKVLNTLSWLWSRKPL
jgi:hypothetical protein